MPDLQRHGKRCVVTTLCLHPMHLKPTEATHGQLCEGHHTALIEAITQAPALVMWVREHIQHRTGDGEHVRTSKDPPAPGNLAAIDDADYLHAQLAGWARLVLEERPELQGPKWQGTRRNKAGEPIGLTDARATAGIAAFLLTHIDHATAQPWIGDMAREITLNTSHLHRKYPQAEASRRLSSPCLRCNHKTITYTPPGEPGWPVLIRCTTCNHIVPEEYYGHYIRVALDSAA